MTYPLRLLSITLMKVTWNSQKRKMLKRMKTRSVSKDAVYVVGMIAPSYLYCVTIAIGRFTLTASVPWRARRTPSIVKIVKSRSLFAFRHKETPVYPELGLELVAQELASYRKMAAELVAILGHQVEGQIHGSLHGSQYGVMWIMLFIARIQDHRLQALNSYLECDLLGSGECRLLKIRVAVLRDLLGRPHYYSKPLLRHRMVCSLGHRGKGQKQNCALLNRRKHWSRYGRGLHLSERGRKAGLRHQYHSQRVQNGEC